MKRRFTEDSWRKEPWFKALANAVAKLSSEEDAANFLRDIATLSELKALSERFEVAKQLAQGKTYRDIATATGASTTTVTRVANFLENGEGGYRKALKAHRHHRMSSGASTSAQGATADRREERPASVLQKYLDKR